MQQWISHIDKNYDKSGHLELVCEEYS